MAKAAWRRVLILWIWVFPFICVCWAAIWGGPVAACEGGSFLEGFLWVLQSMTTAAFPLTAWPGPGRVATACGVVTSNIVGVFHQFTLAFCIGMTAGPMVEPMLDWGVGPFRCLSGKLFVAKRLPEFWPKWLVSLGLFVLLSVLLALLLGSLIAVAEGWPWEDGFVMVLGLLTSANSQMAGTPRSLQTPGGIVLGFYAGVAAEAMIGLLVAIMSVPLLGFDLNWQDSQLVKKYATLFLNDEQRARVGLGKKTGGVEEAPKTATPMDEI